MRKRSRLNGFPSHGVLAIGQLKRQRRRRRRKRKRFLEDNEFLKEFVSGWSGIVFPVGRIGRAEIYRATVRPVKVGVSRVISAGGSSERYNRIKSAIVFSCMYVSRVRFRGDKPPFVFVTAPLSVLVTEMLDLPFGNETIW